MEAAGGGGTLTILQLGGAMKRVLRKGIEKALTRGEMAQPRGRTLPPRDGPACEQFDCQTTCANILRLKTYRAPTRWE